MTLNRSSDTLRQFLLYKYYIYICKYINVIVDEIWYVFHHGMLTCLNCMIYNKCIWLRITSYYTVAVCSGHLGLQYIMYTHKCAQGVYVFYGSYMHVCASNMHMCSSIHSACLCWSSADYHHQVWRKVNWVVWRPLVECLWAVHSNMVITSVTLPHQFVYCDEMT